MEFSTDTEGYYRRMLQLQDKLRKSEEERLKLEEKFHEMMQRSRDVEHEQLRIIRHRYHKFLEEDKIRQERNENILRALDKIEHQAKSLAAKTDRFKTFRKQYFDHYFKHLPPPVRLPQTQPMRESYATNVRKKLFPDTPSKSNENIEAKLALLEKYLRDNFDNFPGDAGTNVPLDKQPPLSYNGSRFANENGAQEHEDMYKKYLSKKMANGLNEFATPRYNTTESDRNKLLGESIEKELEELRNKNVEPNNNSMNIQENNVEHLIHNYKNLVSKSKEMYGLQDDLPIPTTSTKTEQEYSNPSNNNLTTFNKIQITKPKSNIPELSVPQEPLFTSNLDLEENKNVDYEANEQLQNISLVSPKDQDLSTETKAPSDVSLNMSSPTLNKILVDEEILSERDEKKNVMEYSDNKNIQEEIDEATIIENQLSVAPNEDYQKQHDEILLPSTKNQDEVEEFFVQEYDQKYNDIHKNVSQNLEEYPTQPYQKEVPNVEQFDSNVNEFGESIYEEKQYQQQPQQYQEEPQLQEYIEGNDQGQYSQQIQEQDYVEQQESYVDEQDYVEQQEPYVEEQQDYVEQQEPYVAEQQDYVEQQEPYVEEQQYAQHPEEQNKLYAEQEQYNGQIVDGDEHYSQQQQQYVEEQEMYKQNNEEYDQQQYNEGEEQGAYNEGQQEQQFIEVQEQFAENQQPYQENQEQYLPQEEYEQENINTAQYVENLAQGQENYQEDYEQQNYPAYQQQQNETHQEYPQEGGEYTGEYPQENYAPVDQQYTENPENYDAQNVYQTQQEYIEGEQNIDMQYQEQNQYDQDPVSQEYQQEQVMEDVQGSQPYGSETIEGPNMPIIEKKLPNLADMLDTDTSESLKQDTKISNDSDFDFTNT